MEAALRFRILASGEAQGMRDPREPKNGVGFRVIWALPNIKGTLLGVPIIRTIIFWGLYWGPLVLGNYHMLELYMYTV